MRPGPGPKSAFSGHPEDKDERMHEKEKPSNQAEGSAMDQERLKLLEELQSEPNLQEDTFVFPMLARGCVGGTALLATALFLRSQSLGLLRRYAAMKGAKLDKEQHMIRMRFLGKYRSWHENHKFFFGYSIFFTGFLLASGSKMVQWYYMEEARAKESERNVQSQERELQEMRKRRKNKKDDTKIVKEESDQWLKDKAEFSHLTLSDKVPLSSLLFVESSNDKSVSSSLITDSIPKSVSDLDPKHADEKRTDSSTPATKDNKSPAENKIIGQYTETGFKNKYQDIKPS